jgi:hypothetical protein
MENGAELSWWDRIKIAITPKSHAEAMVDAIYGPDGRGLIPVPQTYDAELASEPADYVEFKQVVTGRIDKAVEAITGTVSGAQSFFIKIAVIAFIGVMALVAINAFIRR